MPRASIHWRKHLLRINCTVRMASSLAAACALVVLSLYSRISPNPSPSLPGGLTHEQFQHGGMRAAIVFAHGSSQGVSPLVLSGMKSLVIYFYCSTKGVCFQYARCRRRPFIPGLKSQGVSPPFL